MASGSYHGGSSHSGSYHSSGGGSHGGGSHGSGGSHGGSGGSYYSGGGDVEGFMIVFIAVIAIIMFTLANIQKGNVPGLNLINLGIFIGSGFLFIPSVKQNARTAELRTVWKENFTKRKVKSEFISPERIGNKYTWAGKHDKNYCISFDEPQYGGSNVEKVRQFMRRTPRIIWVRPYTWIVIAVCIAVCNFFFYELVIPFFERAKMTDQAFKFIDSFIFYLPSILFFICPVLSFIFVNVRDRYLHRCALSIAEDNLAAEERRISEEMINSALSEKWYYNICPNCGAYPSQVLKHCDHCGASLEVDSFENGTQSSVHKISLKE